MDQTQDFQSLQSQIQAALVATTRTAGSIASEDLSFQRSLNPEVGTSLDEQNARLLALSNRLLKSATSLSDIKFRPLQDVEDVDNSWGNVVDVVDLLLEKAATSIDEYTGAIKRRDQTSSPKPKNQPLANSFRTQNLLKPQLSFQNKPDNSDTSPWKPLLSSKPHAIVPLEESLRKTENDWKQIVYQHPYEKEIQQLKYPDAVYKTADPIHYLPVEGTTATFVDTMEGVREMLKDLREAKEIAVDLEHHDARSYVGIVSLMQISTREKDWIVDTLKPWRQDLQILNEVFADPKIVKVFHGAYMDIIWLQRDLGLYVVGLFDTFHASRVLGYPAGNLAYLLKRFVDFDADKKYQMADWRIRPLPQEMFFYARADTHFLLYIYDNMRNELVTKSNPAVPDENRIELVLQKSKETSLLRYDRQLYDEETGKGPGGWYQLLAKSSVLYNYEQFAVFKAVHKWRDDIARADDDNATYVMPNHMLFTIAKIMPVDMFTLLGIIKTASHTVKSRASELLELIQSSKEHAPNVPNVTDILRPKGLAATITHRGSIPRFDHNKPINIVDGGEIRSGRSAFWGAAFGSSIWDASTNTAKSADLRLAIPLPELSSEVFATPERLLPDRSRAVDTSTISAVKETATANPQLTDSDEAFVIKKGVKRKNEAVADMGAATTTGNQDSTGEYDISFNEEEELQLQEKAAAKARRKAEKKQLKAQRKLAQEQAKRGGAGEDDDEEPFDYSKAESVLHGKPNANDNEKNTKRKKPFDPYTKSGDAPKGMRRVQTERSGKSHTFRS
ncbi:ribonuclease H-like domain-containing protein [Xylogone sp. PMI_703]|nr:ribonuclease H-like domain-containing protein [Xylogone sp. PMI_703]